MGGTSCSAVQDWTQEDSRDSPSPIVGADPPTSPRYAAVDAVLFISCLMQEVLRQRSVARLCAGRLRRRSGGLLGAAARRRRVGGGASAAARRGCRAPPTHRRARRSRSSNVRIRGLWSVGHRAPRRGGSGSSHIVSCTFTLIFVYWNTVDVSWARCGCDGMRERALHT